MSASPSPYTTAPLRGAPLISGPRSGEHAGLPTALDLLAPLLLRHPAPHPRALTGPDGPVQARRAHRAAMADPLRRPRLPPPQRGLPDREEQLRAAALAGSVALPLVVAHRPAPRASRGIGPRLCRSREPEWDHDVSDRATL